MNDTPQYFSGTVETYDEKNGFGYIRPDEEWGQEFLLVHRNSLRTGVEALSIGQRVLFKKESVPRGILASDVHPEILQSSESFDDLYESSSGKIVKWDSDRRYGFIRTHSSPDVFFHFTSLVDTRVLPQPGDVVTFKVSQNEKGLLASEVAIQESANGDLPKDAKNILAQAVLAREEKRYAEAERIYRMGLKEHPSEHLISSYAAFRKNRSEKQEALDIYELGASLYPKSAKIREDAGHLAANLGLYDKAIQYLSQSLRLVGGSGRPGAKGILNALGMIHYRRGGNENFRTAIQYYEEAIRAYGGMDE